MNSSNVLWEGRPSLNRFKFHSIDYMPIYIGILGSLALGYLFAMIIINDIFILLPLIIQIVIVLLVILPLFLIICKVYSIHKMITNTRFKISFEGDKLKLFVFRRNDVKRIENLKSKYLYISRKTNDVLILDEYLELDDYRLTIFISSLMYKPKFTLKLTAIEKNSFIKSIKPYFRHYRSSKHYFIAQIDSEY